MNRRVSKAQNSDFGFPTGLAAVTDTEELFTTESSYVSMPLEPGPSGLQRLRKVGGTSGAESETNGKRIDESHLVFHDRSYIRDRAVRHLTFLKFLPLVASNMGGAARRVIESLQ